MKLLLIRRCLSLWMSFLIFLSVAACTTITPLDQLRIAVRNNPKDFKLREQLIVALYHRETVKPTDSQSFLEAIQHIKYLQENQDDESAKEKLSEILFECLQLTNQLEEAKQLAASLLDDDEWVTKQLPETHGDWIARRAKVSAMLHSSPIDIVSDLILAMHLSPTNTQLFMTLVSTLNAELIQELQIDWRGLASQMEELAKYYEEEQNADSVTRILFPLFDLLDMVTDHPALMSSCPNSEESCMADFDGIDVTVRRAWKILEQGNETWRYHLTRIGHKYVPELEESQFETLQGTFSKGMIASLSSLSFRGHEERDIIFVVGLPRAGSTLIDQLLQSHSAVGSVGEHSAFNSRLPDFRNALVTDIESGTIHSIRETLKKFTVEILDASEQSMYNPNRSSIVVDKMLFNYRNIGFIYSLFPNAKVIHVKKTEFWSHALSLYKRAFAPGVADWMYSFQDIIHFYSVYEATMRHWEEVLPGKILHIAYEDLVSDTETTVRKIARYCGLQFETAMLEPHKSKRIVHTQSAQQVTRPIQKSLSESWKKYGILLLKSLQQEGATTELHIERIQELQTKLPP